MKSILLVDDSATVLLGMGNILTKAGWPVKPVAWEQLLATIKLAVR